MNKAKRMIVTAALASMLIGGSAAHAAAVDPRRAASLPEAWSPEGRATWVASVPDAWSPDGRTERQR